ncbi:hypothetical protein AB1Y20_020866 [Prymnesium parvum]|uniref:Transmembrane protein n=1 Tax=Prymnesium parvum TaxID=97485 RepID=A0AB34JZE9_PRYPA
MLRLGCLFLALAPAAAFHVPAHAVRPQAVPAFATRSPAPLCQFGTGNFDSSKTDSFFLSPVPGKAKGYKPPAEPAQVNPLAVAYALTPFLIPVFFCFFLLVAVQGEKLPFPFLDGLYPSF